MSNTYCQKYGFIISPEFAERQRACERCHTDSSSCWLDSKEANTPAPLEGGVMSEPKMTAQEKAIEFVRSQGKDACSNARYFAYLQGQLDAQWADANPPTCTRKFGNRDKFGGRVDARAI